MYFLNTVIRFKMMDRRHNSVVCPVHRYIVNDNGAPEKIGKKGQFSDNFLSFCDETYF